MPRLTEHRAVLTIQTPLAKRHEGVEYGHPSIAEMPSVRIAFSRYIEMEQPDTVTVTVQPGYTLNERR